MSLHPQPIPAVPAETVRVARAAFPNGNGYLQLRDEWGTMYDDDLFSDLYPAEGQPAIRPWRLALVTVLPFAENVPDRQAAEAVRSRIDWKYLLGLELTEPGFDYSVLCEFRARLLAGEKGEVLLERLLDLLQTHGLLKSRGRQRTDSTPVLATVRDLSRLEWVGWTLLQVLHTLARVAPEWLQSHVPADGSQRDDARWDDYRWPQTEAERLSLAEPVGRDGRGLFLALGAADAPAWLRPLPAVETFRRVWLQNF